MIHTIFIYFIAFLGGCLGSMFSPMIMVISYGFASLFAPLAGNSFFSEYIVNIMLSPAVAFAGGIPAMSFAAYSRKHKEVTGLDIFTPNWEKTNDFMPHLIGGIFGILGYLIVSLCTRYAIPGDAGAISIVICNLILRLVMYRQKLLTCDKKRIKDIFKHLWYYKSTRLITPFIWGAFVGVVVFFTGNTSVMFSVCVASLVFKFIRPEFPITHHISVAASVAAYTLGMGNLVEAVVWGGIFGMIAGAVFEIASVLIVYGKFWNDQAETEAELMTYIDPPSCAVLFSTLCISLLGVCI